MNTAAMCRQQEALHRQAAADTPLANARRIELRAAEAWKIQAEEAMQAETGGGEALSAEDAAIALEFLMEEAEEEPIEEDGPDHDGSAARRGDPDPTKPYPTKPGPTKKASHDIA